MLPQTKNGEGVSSRSTADKLMGMIAGKLKEMLAVAAEAIAHRRLQIRLQAVHCEDPAASAMNLLGRPNE
jgi:hypothetical protein